MLKADTVVGIVVIVLLGALANKYLIRQVWPVTSTPPSA
jgi:hypothetical protein